MSISLIDLKHFLAHYPLEVQEIFMGVREVVYSVVPEVVEDFHLNGISYLRPGMARKHPARSRPAFAMWWRMKKKCRSGFGMVPFYPTRKKFYKVIAKRSVLLISTVMRTPPGRHWKHCLPPLLSLTPTKPFDRTEINPNTINSRFLHHR